MGKVSAQPAVAAHVTLDQLHIYIVDKPGNAPLLLIFSQLPGQSPHNGLGGQHMLYRVSVLDIAMDGIKNFVPVELRCHVNTFSCVVDNIARKYFPVKEASF